jgi:hypothetical protein
MMARLGDAWRGQSLHGAARRRVAGAMVGILAALAIAAPVDAAACRLHSIWHYPWPQRCGAAHQMVRLQILANSRKQVGREKPAIELPTDGMPIPALSWKVEGEPDELARARLLLRAALEDAHAD